MTAKCIIKMEGTKTSITNLKVLCFCFSHTGCNSGWNKATSLYFLFWFPKLPDGIAGDSTRDRTKTFTYDFSYDSTDCKSSSFVSQEKVDDSHFFKNVALKTRSDTNLVACSVVLWSSLSPCDHRLPRTPCSAWTCRGLYAYRQGKHNPHVADSPKYQIKRTALRCSTEHGNFLFTSPQAWWEL